MLNNKMIVQWMVTCL